MAIKGLILDLDGVICDTAHFHYEAWRQLAKEYGYELTEEKNEELKGVSRKDSLDLILKWAGHSLSHDAIEYDMQRKNEWYLKLIDKMTADDALPGMGVFFNKAKILNYKIGLGSASKNAKMVLTKLNLFHLFDCIVDANEVSKGKPNPETFLKAAAGLGLQPEECAVFEDSVAGIKAANDGNMLSIGIGTAQNLPGAKHIFEGLGIFDFSILAE